MMVIWKGIYFLFFFYTWTYITYSVCLLISEAPLYQWAPCKGGGHSIKSSRNLYLNMFLSSSPVLSHLHLLSFKWCSTLSSHMGDVPLLDTPATLIWYVFFFTILFSCLLLTCPYHISAFLFTHFTTAHFIPSLYRPYYISHTFSFLFPFTIVITDAAFT